jgi:hypothetical protein
MPQVLHEGNRGVVIGILESNLVGHQLIMQTRFSQCFSSRETLVNRMNDVLDSGSDDATSACRSGDQEEFAIRSFDNRRRDG